MRHRNTSMDEINPETLLRAYAYGVFPMGEARGSDTLYWVDPELRGILPLDTFHVPRRLARTIKAEPFTIKVDSAFRSVMEACAADMPGRGGTWINAAILKAYSELHEQGHTHSVECWQGSQLVGGLYGVSLGRAFFGESMFSHVRDASKVALVHLAARLIQGGYVLLDTQFVTSHLSQFGAIEIPRDDYKSRLADALTGEPGDFYSIEAGGRDVSAADILQSINQTS
ncbi:MAG: leucyl/phenylalanyl-tRNA--protein transferase [Parvibaculum sp.]|nr:leucyl/phenylalanyl-tRNA--protein transferase [Parvibaculum sp.]